MKKTIIILISVTLVFFVSFLIYSSKNPEESSSSNTISKVYDKIVSAVKPDDSLEEDSETDETTEDESIKKYSNDGFKISFEYPKEFEISESAKEGVLEVRVRTTKGSEFIYISNNQGVKLNEKEVCSSSDRNGIEESGKNMPCEFPDSGFARYIFDTGIDEDIWYITEKWTDSNEIYYVNTNNMFRYEIRDLDDLDLLDSVMKSVKRL